jgi:hypothetical protein
MKISCCKYYFLLFLVLCKQVSWAKNPLETLSILDAAKQKLVSVKVRGKGGYNGQCLNLEIKNMTSKQLTIKVLAGTIFDNTEEWQQDLMVVEEQVIALRPQNTDLKSLQTVCIQPSNGSPAKGVSFLLWKLAEGHLLKLAQLMSEKKYFNSTAQSAIWAVINGNGLENIYGEDSLMVKELCAIVSEATGQPCTSNNYKIRPHQITSISTSLDVLVPDYVKNANLTLYRRNGQVFRQHSTGLALPPGFYRFKMGVNHTLSDTSTFYLRLEENGRIISEKIVSKQDSVPELQKMKETSLTYDIDNEVEARIGIYDENDNLYIMLADKKLLKKGFHKSEFLDAKRELPLNKNYYFKVKNKEKTLAQQKVLLDRDEAKKYAPITKRGTFACKLEQDIAKAKLAVYDSEDNIVWVIFADSKLYKGGKSFSYVFQHQQGSEANFVIKLTDEKGNVVASQEIKGN